METKHTNVVALEDIPVNIKIKLSGLWIVLMMIYIYVDILAFFEPGSIEQILDGKVWELDITQAWALTALVLMLIPSFMIFLSLALPAKQNRMANIIVGALYVLAGIGTMVGEDWAYYLVGHTTGIGVLALVIWYAWNWPSAPENREEKI